MSVSASVSVSKSSVIAGAHTPKIFPTGLTRSLGRIEQRELLIRLAATRASRSNSC